MSLSSLKPGTRVRVEQTVAYRDRAWSQQVEGVVQAVRREPTGSWFAHGKNGRLWLWRLDLLKDDGELTKLCLDSRTKITILKSDGQAG